LSALWDTGGLTLGGLGLESTVGYWTTLIGSSKKSHNNQVRGPFSNSGERTCGILEDSGEADWEDPAPVPDRDGRTVRH